MDNDVRNNQEMNVFSAVSKPFKFNPPHVTCNALNISQLQISCQLGPPKMRDFWGLPPIWRLFPRKIPGKPIDDFSFDLF